MQQHYEQILAPLYKWMLGDWEAALDRSRAELRTLGIPPARPEGRALDLGAGPGLQSIPLAELGYHVTAVDTSSELLAELARACPHAAIVHGDITDPKYGAGEYDVIVCMGDTLTHMPSEAAVEGILAAAYKRLTKGGRLVLTFRDYSGAPPEPARCFILVRGEAERILTCHLDYQPTRVRVTDVVHELAGGCWTLRASTYEKLRLSPGWVRERLSGLGFELDRLEPAQGRVAIVARRA